MLQASVRRVRCRLLLAALPLVFLLLVGCGDDAEDGVDVDAGAGAIDAGSATVAPGPGR